MKRIVVALTGATGSVYGLRLLEMLRDQGGWETHLVLSQAALLNIREEIPDGRRLIEAAADVVHSVRNVGASIASGSFLCDGMVIAPCSMRTLAAVANGLSDNLITRAADVMLKERRRLVLMTRETPLNLAHLRNMVACTEMGAVVFPPVPAFYARPDGIDAIVNHSSMRVLDLFGVHRNVAERWQGLTKEGADATPVPATIERQA
ncbi:UbiX family flavin prenyltransferase [Novosphingobium sp. Gsoil 351]|uniref:UbiX family flavin prenyltransferase n=1 Tax=Novosphingobium sp. Gsoil 351 TaxID=2675225 RepID=UPI0012B4517A|nr:UbiX family flavin prenyltransferase [Novosphingobium sp. Gsoil 351]QGN54023.1 UbiX family flavin prenyltransferase [Novosphingobium sp. Gsoil 351]